MSTTPTPETFVIIANIANNELIEAFKAYCEKHKASRISDDIFMFYKCNSAEATSYFQNIFPSKERLTNRFYIIRCDSWIANISQTLDLEKIQKNIQVI